MKSDKKHYLCLQNESEMKTDADKRGIANPQVRVAVEAAFGLVITGNSIGDHIDRWCGGHVIDFK